MGRSLRRGILFTLLMACAAPAFALDPVLMFLLSTARNMMERRAQEQAAQPQAPEPLSSDVYPGTSVRPQYLHQLIDDSFLYLSDSQRAEIFDSLNKALLDPRNAAVRGTMIDYFARKALAVRAAQLKLAQLSQPEKQRLAEEFRREVATLPPKEQAQVGELLRGGLLPVPGDFNQMLLAAFESR